MFINKLIIPIPDLRPKLLIGFYQSQISKSGQTLDTDRTRSQIFTREPLAKSHRTNELYL